MLSVLSCTVREVAKRKEEIASLQLGSLDIASVDDVQPGEWIALNIDTGAARSTFPRGFGVSDGAPDPSEYALPVRSVSSAKFPKASWSGMLLSGHTR